MNKVIVNKFIKNLHLEVDKLNNFLLKYSQSEKTNLLNKIAYHIISSGGKRIRPLLTIATCKLFNPNQTTLNKCLDLASAIEFIHNATLLHDDVVDNSNTRRNNITANHIWGNKSSILVGDFLFSQSFKQMIKTKNLNVLEILANTSAEIAEAEVWQLELIGKLDIKFDEYINLISAKTANLFSAACLCSSMLANASKKQETVLKNYGLNLGIIFQINDDIKDFFSNFDELGKKPGSDFYENKITLPTIIALKNVSREDSKILENLFSQKNKGTQHFNQLISLFEKYNIKYKSYQILEQYVQKALENFDIIPDSEYKKLFIDLIKSYQITYIANSL